MAGPLRRAEATAATTAGVFSMVCVGTKATEESVVVSVTAFTPWWCLGPPPPVAAHSLALPRLYLGFVGCPFAATPGGPAVRSFLRRGS